jgi:endonuclease/exonuclease/phosphatase (EEP) superfamily protein YafD
VIKSGSSSSQGFSLRAQWLLLMTVALWLALAAAFLGRWWWPLDLFAHFQVQYAVLFAFLVFAALVAKRRAVALLAGVGAIASGAPVVMYAGLSSASASASTAEFRLISFNTWYRNRDHTRVREYLERMNADVVVLQEITPQQVEALKESLPQYSYTYSDAAKPHGAAVMSRWPIVSATPLELTHDGARAAEVRVQWREAEISVIGVHLHWPLGPNASRMRNMELGALVRRAHEIDGPLLISGDFNITPWSSHLRRFAREAGLADCARGHGLATTWPAQFPPLQIRIDHCFASPQWRVVSVSSGPELGSDHRPMVAELELN